MVLTTLIHSFFTSEYNNGALAVYTAIHCSIECLSIIENRGQIKGKRRVTTFTTELCAWTAAAVAVIFKGLLIILGFHASCMRDAKGYSLVHYFLSSCPRAVPFGHHQPYMMRSPLVFDYNNNVSPVVQVTSTRIVKISKLRYCCCC